MHQQWPRTMWIVRHGQSAGNVARDAAELAGLPVIDIEHRDIDTPLSDLGKTQALALDQWFGEMPRGRQPQVILGSPYVRARETTQLLLAAARIGSRGRRCAAGQQRALGFPDARVAGGGAGGAAAAVRLGWIRSGSG